MKRVTRTLVALAVLGVVAYASIFAIAEIFTEVVVLRTYDAEGFSHETRVTVIDRAGTPWVRGRPYRGWFRRIEKDPRADLYRDGAWHPVEGTVSRDPDDAAAFDQVMLDTYGLAYRWVDVIARISANEVPVRLVPVLP